MSWIQKYKIGLCLGIFGIIAVYPIQAVSAQQLACAIMEDGVVLKVHLEEEPTLEKIEYARDILEVASLAYEEVVFKQGFNRKEYTFVSADRNFAYDSDRTIDIYIADVEAPFALMTPENKIEYKAKIFFPEDYRQYWKRFEIKHPRLELKASLTHELLHIITYSYNRNMQIASQGKVSLASTNWDWYVEGLARYFEVLTGYYDEFLSSGFRKKCGSTKTIVYKGGVNYFLKYPDKPLNERKYDFAIFWQYLHQNYGMEKIEEISCKFREVEPRHCTNQEAMQIIAQSLNTPLKNLIRNFSLYVYKVSSLPAREESRLNPVSICELSSDKDAISTISSFGFDFYEVDLNKEAGRIQLKTFNGKRDLNCLIGIRAPFHFSSIPVETDASGRVMFDAEDLAQNSRIIIMLSNPTDETIFYQISLN